MLLLSLGRGLQGLDSCILEGALNHMVSVLKLTRRTGGDILRSSTRIPIYSDWFCRRDPWYAFTEVSEDKNAVEEVVRNY